MGSQLPGTEVFLCRRTALALCCDAGKTLLTVNGLDSSLDKIIVAGVEYLASLRHFLKVPCHRILNQVNGATATSGGQFVESGLGLGL